MQYFKLPIEDEKNLELNINCCEGEIVAGEKEITIRDYRLVFLSR